MKVNKKPMSVWQKIFYLLSFIFLIGAFIYLGTKNFDTPPRKLTDQEAFTKEYKITKDNLYIYKSGQEVLEILNTGSGIIFMGYSENKWSSIIAEVLNEVASNLGLKELYYYNFKKDRSNNNSYYENIVNQLKPFLPILDNDVVNIYAPAVLIVKNGEIIYFDDETSIMRGEKNISEYWTVEKKHLKKEEYQQALQKFLEKKKIYE